MFFSLMMMGVAGAAFAQVYPEPEFAKEVYFLNKDTVPTAIRLEKSSSKMDNKAKMGGMGGSESSYSIDGDKSSVRIHGGSKLSFVYSTGASASTTTSTAARDSMLKANGVDASMMEGINSFNDPSNTITLYKVETGKDKRKIISMKTPGMGFGSKKIKSSDKYTFSLKKIREGYWEFIIDKTLPKGEYAFTMMDMKDMATGGSLIFAFGVD